jgi:hypothetical protein
MCEAGEDLALLASHNLQNLGCGPDVRNEMGNVLNDREGVCPMETMQKIAEV